MGAAREPVRSQSRQVSIVEVRNALAPASSQGDVTSSRVLIRWVSTGQQDSKVGLKCFGGVAATLLYKLFQTVLYSEG